MAITASGNVGIGTTTITSGAKLEVSGTTAASSSVLGTVVIGNLTAATTVGIGGGNINAGGTITAGGNVVVNTAGSTVTIKSGSNALAGTVTLVAGAGTITSTAIDANTVIVLSIKTSGGTPSVYHPNVAVAAGSATITGLATDTSVYNWIGFKVN